MNYEATEVHEGDFKPDNDMIIKMSSWVFFLSITSAWTGLSSVLALIPSLLLMIDNMDPREAIATSGSLTFFVSAASTIQLLI